jgi:glycosyltransferase involved in cell wall biosynthesis
MTGVGRHVIDVIKAMTARGHEVHLLHSVARCDETLLHELEHSSGFHRQAFPMRRQPHWSDVWVLMALARYVQRFGPFDVMHGHSSKGGVYARLLSVFFPGMCLYTPARLHHHGAASYAPGARSLCSDRALPRARHRHPDLLFPRGGAARGEPCIRKERLAVIPNAIAPFDVSKAPRLRKRLGLPTDTVVIGFVGRLDEQKAPRVLVEAAADVLARGHEVHIVMIGTGPLRTELETLATWLGISQRFIWLGETPARGWISGFDLLAMPSLYEGFPYVLLEALCAGVPIVCTPVGGVREAGLADGVHGFIVPFGDRDALADRLCRLIADPDLRQAMGRRAQELSAHLSLDEMIDRLEATYRLALRAAGALPSPAPSGL